MEGLEGGRGYTVQYDPAVIQQFAERLYALARRIFATATILGVLLGFILGAALAAAMQGRSENIGTSSGQVIAMGLAWPCS